MCTVFLFFPTYHSVHRCLCLPPRRIYRTVREMARKKQDSVRAEARVTPSHPVVSLLIDLFCCAIPSSHSFIVPLSVLVFGFQAVKFLQEQEMSPEMKDGEARGEGDWPGGGNVEAPGEI